MNKVTYHRNGKISVDGRVLTGNVKLIREKRKHYNYSHVWVLYHNEVEVLFVIRKDVPTLSQALVDINQEEMQPFNWRDDKQRTKAGHKLRQPLADNRIHVEGIYAAGNKLRPKR